MTRRGLGSYGDDDVGGHRSKAPVEVSLFVHKVLPQSLLCSEHGRNEYQNRELVKGKIIPLSVITWPNEREKEKFDSFETEERPMPTVFTFAVEEWIAYEKGLI